MTSKLEMVRTDLSLSCLPIIRELGRLVTAAFVERNGANGCLVSSLWAGQKNWYVRSGGRVSSLSMIRTK